MRAVNAPRRRLRLRAQARSGADQETSNHDQHAPVRPADPYRHRHRRRGRGSSDGHSRRLQRRGVADRGRRAGSQPDLRCHRGGLLRVAVLGTWARRGATGRGGGHRFGVRCIERSRRLPAANPPVAIIGPSLGVGMGNGQNRRQTDATASACASARGFCGGCPLAPLPGRGRPEITRHRARAKGDGAGWSAGNQHRSAGGAAPIGGRRVAAPLVWSARWL